MFRAAAIARPTRQRISSSPRANASPPALFHAPDCKCVCFTKNVTESLNVLLKGFLHPGDHVLVSSMEHNAVMRPLRQLETQGVSFSRVPCRPDGTLIFEAMEGLLQPNTRLVVMSHASNVCGTLLPVKILSGAVCTGIMPR